uniref:Fibrinogen C-terminal domain-containing protein n=1 Tax=Eptatretus burgeri TaxID=7764 RepID=A0A8C4X1E8_EPTBU
VYVILTVVDKKKSEQPDIHINGMRLYIHDTHPPDPVPTPSGPWRDCHQAWEAGIRTSGVTLLRPVSDKAPIRAWCDHDRDPGGWTVIQRREDGSINFDRPWKAYWRGFGSPRGENWLGLQAMHALTSKENQRLIILLEDWIGHHTVAEYGSFRVGSEVENGKLHLGHYRGTAGDALGVHDGRPFSARNRDNDAFAGNCATKQRGGWWYNACAQANLNGIWHQGGTYNGGEQLGIFWEPFHGTAYSLRRVVMMIRPNPNFYH